MAHDELAAPVAADATVDLGQAGCGDLTPLIRGRLRELQSGQVLEVISEEPAAHEGQPNSSRMLQGAWRQVHMAVQALTVIFQSDAPGQLMRRSKPADGGA